MKRIWMVTLKDFDYMPLRAGLGLISKKEFQEWQDKQNENALTCVGYLCPKLYTTRTHRLSGEYYVVEGSRYKAKPVEPRIEFQVTISEEIDLKRAIFKKGETICGWAIADRNGLTYPELDLGVCGTTFEQLRDELLRLNKKATINTPFYVNMIEPI